MSMKKSENKFYDANGMPSGAKVHSEKTVAPCSMTYAVKGEGSKMEGRMARAFTRKEGSSKAY